MVNINTKSVILPTLLAILLSIGGLGIPIPGTTEGTPWLIAHHTQDFSDGQQVRVDNLVYFLWGQEYTVVGFKLIQTHYTPFDWRDFPFYSMLGLALAIISGVLALISNRNVTFTIKGKELRLRGIFPPTPMLLLAMVLVSLSTIYLYNSANVTIIPELQRNNYVPEYSYGFQFMGASAVAFLISAIMTFRNILATRSAVTSENIYQERQQKREPVGSFQYYADAFFHS